MLSDHAPATPPPRNRQPGPGRHPGNMNGRSGTRANTAEQSGPEYQVRPISWWRKSGTGAESPAAVRHAKSMPIVSETGNTAGKWSRRSNCSQGPRNSGSSDFAHNNRCCDIAVLRHDCVMATLTSILIGRYAGRAEIAREDAWRYPESRPMCSTRIRYPIPAEKPRPMPILENRGLAATVWLMSRRIEVSEEQAQRNRRCQGNSQHRSCSITISGVAVMYSEGD